MGYLKNIFEREALQKKSIADSANRLTDTDRLSDTDKETDTDRLNGTDKEIGTDRQENEAVGRRNSEKTEQERRIQTGGIG